MKLEYHMPTGKVLTILKKANLVPHDVTLNYISSIPNVLVKLINSQLIYEAGGNQPGGIRILINPEKFDEGVKEMGTFLRNLKLPLYHDEESLVEPTNHMGWNPLGMPLSIMQ
jgi:hypothetical protein